MPRSYIDNLAPETDNRVMKIYHWQIGILTAIIDRTAAAVQTTAVNCQATDRDNHIRTIRLRGMALGYIALLM